MKNEQIEKDAYNLFSKIEVNVPLLEYLKATPKYMRFLKELCTTKRKCKPNEIVQVGSNVSAIFQPQLAVKCTDPGSFTVPCTVGNLNIPHALLDLGAAINVMPLSVFKTLKGDNRNALIKTTMKIRLADQTVREPLGLLEDVLVRVKNLVFPVDFYVMDMSRDQDMDSPLILGRPFMRTANTIVSLKDGCISMQVGGHTIRFNVYETMKHPFEDYSLLDVNQVDSIEEEVISEHALSLIEEKHNDDHVFVATSSYELSSPSSSSDHIHIEPQDDISLMSNEEAKFMDDLIANHDSEDTMACNKCATSPCMSMRRVPKNKKVKKKKGVAIAPSVSHVTQVDKPKAEFVDPFLPQEHLSHPHSRMNFMSKLLVQVVHDAAKFRKAYQQSMRELHKSQDHASSSNAKDTLDPHTLHHASKEGFGQNMNVPNQLPKLFKENFQPP